MADSTTNMDRSDDNDENDDVIMAIAVMVRIVRSGKVGDANAKPNLECRDLRWRELFEVERLAMTC